MPKHELTAPHKNSATRVIIAAIALALLLVACGTSSAPDGDDGGDGLVAAGGDAQVVPAVSTTVEPVIFVPTIPAHQGPTQLDMNVFEVGGQAHEVTDANANIFHQTGMKWVKFQLKWAPGLDAQGTARFIANAHENGLRVLLSMPSEAYPPSIDFGEYTQYLGAVAALGPDAIEIWNEMNLDREWPANDISAASYVTNMLAPAYNTIKGVNPNIMVISGALAPTGAFGGCSSIPDGPTGCNDDTYIADMVAAGAENFMDCAGIHFNSGATSPSATTNHPADSGAGHYSWYYSGTVQVYGNTFSKPLCFTELGYVSPEGFDGIADNFGWGAATTVAQQAQWLGETVQLARDSGNVRLIIIWNVDIQTYAPDDPQAGYAIVRPDGTCPACPILASQLR